MILAAHVLPRVAPRWFLVARGGLEKDLAVSISGTGFAEGLEGHLTSTLGGFGEGGVYKVWGVEQRWACSVSFRYTKLTYTTDVGAIDAQSFMLFTDFYYNP
jgi:hypothetical protein